MMAKLVIPLFIVLFFSISCKNKQEKIKPTEEKITESVYASGIVKSTNQYQVFSTTNGLIAKLYVTEGDIVKKGDPIMRLINTTAQLNTENARLSANYASVTSNAEKLRELKINMDLAKTKMLNDASLLQRQRNLWSQQIGSANDVDQRELAYKTSSNANEAATLRYIELKRQINFQQQQALKNLEIAKTQAGDFTIKSEVNGKVYTVLKEQGELVTPQSPVAVIGDAQGFKLELQVDEYDIARVKPGQTIVLTMDSYKGQVFEAAVQKINPLMNDRSKSFTIDAVFTKAPPTLYPNLTCEANIVILQKEKALTIPRNCLLAGDFVLLENNEKRKVTTGLKDYQKVEMTSGLSAGDIIIKPAP